MSSQKFPVYSQNFQRIGEVDCEGGWVAQTTEGKWLILCRGAELLLGRGKPWRMRDDGHAYFMVDSPATVTMKASPKVEEQESEQARQLIRSRLNMNPIQ